ncbi:MAG: sugar transporter permease, partial [Frondihabitans sp.]|nr:sugar transporter permease [Frondihabitans sp.]
MIATDIDPRSARKAARSLRKSEANAFANSKKRLTSPAATIAAIVIAVIWTIPTFGLFVTSFRPPADINTSGWWTIFTHPALTGSNYTQTLNFNDTITVGQSFINSLVITIPATIFPIAIAALAAYAFAWMNFRGKDALFIGVFSLQVVPIQVALVPMLALFSSGVTIGNWAVFPGLNLNGVAGSYARIWIADTMFALPLAIFLLHNFIAALPADIMEAARVDGAGHGQIFLRIVLPLAMPAIASFAILQFLWVCNDLLVATIFTSGGNFPITKLLTDL